MTITEEKLISPSLAQDPRIVINPENLSKRLPAQLVEDLHSAFGAHRARAVHAKGVILQRNFTPGPLASGLSLASVFTASVPIIVRFSNFTGIPDISDNSHNADPRGFAIKFLMDDGSDFDIVAHSFNGFPVATAADFGLLLRAIAASGSDAAKPTALDQFLASQPIAKTFLTTQKAPPESFATTAFYGVNAVQFTNASGQSCYVRYRFMPEAGEHYLAATTLQTKGPDYLKDEIQSRVASGPARFTWYAQISGPGDAIEDPSIAWSEDRQLVELGVLTIDRVAANDPVADRALLFLPGTLPAGIGVADPMLTIRNAAYPVSFHQRQ